MIALLLISFLLVAAFAARSQTKAADPAAAIRKNNLGVAYMNQQRMAQALALFREAQKINPKLAVARLNEGIALLNLQRTAAARVALLDAAKRLPENPRVWYNLGLLYKNSGEVDKGIAAFERAAKLAPEDVDTQYFIGTLLVQAQRYADAIAAFQSAVRMNPFHASAEFGLSRAFQRTSNEDESRKHLARFQQLTQERLGAPMSLAYGDQGPLSLAQDVGDSAKRAPAAIPVHFVPVPVEQSGLDMGSRSGHGVSRTCVLDYNNDGRPDLLIVSSDSTPGARLFKNTGGHFTETTPEAGLTGLKSVSSCAAGDYDNDGRVDFAIGDDSGIHLFHNEAGGKFRDATHDAGVRWPAHAACLLFFDYDHDGDLDLFATDGSTDDPKPRVLWRNNGNGTFTDWTNESGLGAKELSFSAVASDLNNDRAIDLLVPGLTPLPVIHFNPREGAFRAETPWEPKDAANGAWDAAILDFDHDGWMDVAMVDMQRGITLWRNDRGHSFVQVPFPNPEGFGSFHVVALDYDNDGWVDLAESGCSRESCGVKIFRNEGDGKFRDVSEAAGNDKLWKDGKSPRLDLKALDFDGDGDTDLVLALPDGSVTLLRNDGGNRNNSLRLSLKGLADNKSAIGTKVEVFAGTSYQKFEITSPNDLLIGLGKEKQADVVRLLWPTGVLQDEVNLVAGRRHEIAEIDRRGSSCPILFAWNGAHFEFIADMIGPGIVGHWVAPGERNVPDPTEYLKVSGASVRPRDGSLEFRFIEPMEEVVYLDQVRLLAVDHPAGVDVYPNERFAAEPPFPEFKIIVAKSARPPAGAWDDRGRDVLPELLHRDRRYVTGFADAPFKGFAATHLLELDLGEIKSGRPEASGLRLLMHGFTDYFTATSVYAAQQAGVTAMVPRVDALMEDGRWVRVSDDIGFPAGLARTMVADLTGKLPPGARRIRITTNLKIYWDQILIDATGDDQPYSLLDVQLESATLNFFGYPRELRGNPPADLRYRYEEASATGPYAHHAGNYTRYGKVTPLLRAVDDRFVVFGSGDEVALAFDPHGLPPLPAGWTRDYFFFAHGYSKDMDFYAAYGYTVDPLPFGAMGSYPYRQEERELSTDELNYELNFNTRPVSAAPPRRLRFEFAKERK